MIKGNAVGGITFADLSIRFFQKFPGTTNHWTNVQCLFVSATMISLLKCVLTLSSHTHTAVVGHIVILISFY